jgi:uncharacterized protein (TIGR04255 family)
MRSRPPDLPDFTSPPVSEVSLGVQFNSLENLLAPHLGLVWAEFKNQFPQLEQHPPVEQTFETFAEKGAGMPIPRMQLQLLSSVPTPRVFFINAKRTELLQVQRDHFYHNWRKIGDGDEYPRFERMLETFEGSLDRLSKIFAAENLGSIVPNQCEVTYINHIEVPSGSNSFGVFEKVFGSWLAPPSLADLQGPEDGRFLLRYIIVDGEAAPAGRLIVSAEPAWRLDGTHVVQLSLTARGKPKTQDFAGVSEFLRLGRVHIVKAFDTLTHQNMHKVWGKQK